MKTAHRWRQAQRAADRGASADAEMLATIVESTERVPA